MRNSADYVDRYMEQATRLHKEVGDPFRVIVVEGDSTDDTWDRLQEYKAFASLTTLKVEHGGPPFESVDRPLRWRQIASVCNVGMVAAQRELDDDEPLVYVESDLIWEPETLARLVDHLHEFPAATCLSMQGARFWDTFGYRVGGRRFNPWAPYYPGAAGSMKQIDSCGSVIAMRYEVAQDAFFGHTDCILGLGESIYAAGHSLWLDPTLAVHHP